MVKMAKNDQNGPKALKLPKNLLILIVFESFFRIFKNKFFLKFSKILRFSDGPPLDTPLELGPPPGGRKWPEMTRNDQKWPELMSFDEKLA